MVWISWRELCLIRILLSQGGKDIKEGVIDWIQEMAVFTCFSDIREPAPVPDSNC
jgi:hypothetical protein